MKTAYFPAGRLDVSAVGDRWLLLLGGVTRQGNRRARRIASSALQSGLDVVWFDGFEETDEGSSMRVPLDVVEPGGSLVIVGFENAERRTLSGRLRLGGSLRANPLGRWIWKLLFRRIGSMTRPRACWAVVRSDIRALARHGIPEAIVYGDDYAITSAWYAGQLWRSAPLSTGLPRANT